MSDDPLPALRKFWARAVDEACRELALALAAEETARSIVAEVENEIDRKIETVGRFTSTDADVEALGSWLPQARHRASAARAAAELARGETGRCRALLAAARAVVETADNRATRHGVEAKVAAAHA